MTRDEYRERDARIVAFYNRGERSVTSCAREFALSKQRILQVLKRDGVWTRKTTGRDKFIGVQVTSETRDALKAEASQDSVSLSKLASRVLDEHVAAKKEVDA